MELQQIKATENQKNNINKSKLEYLSRYIANDNTCYLATRIIHYHEED